MPPSDGRFSLWAVLTTAAIVGSAMASGAWYVARAQLDDEMKQYERLKPLQLPQLLGDLRVVSTELKTELRERAELRDLSARTAMLTAENKALTSRFESQAAELAAVRKRIADIDASEFEVHRGEAHEVVPGEIVVGLKSASSIVGKAEVQFAGVLQEIPPGTTLRAVANGIEYRVTLLKIIDAGLGNNDSALFTVAHRPVQSAK